MDLHTLETLLATPGLGLSKDGHTFRSDDEDGIVVLAAGRGGGDLVRFNKVSRVVLEPELTASGLLALERENAYTVIELAALFAVERDTKNQSTERRRTGFV